MSGDLKLAAELTEWQERAEKAEAELATCRQERMDITRERNRLREALRYAKRFLNAQDHNLAFIEAALGEQDGS